jgi:hypothetical protein
MWGITLRTGIPYRNKSGWRFKNVSGRLRIKLILDTVKNVKIEYGIVADLYRMLRS